ncbi:MAG: heavy-metal-associated domain-containing protein [Dehalococcoidia bacterium]
MFSIPSPSAAPLAALSAALRPHLTRLLVAPRVEVVDAAPGEVRVAVHGLVCGDCAARTRAALRSVPGVEDACVDLHAASATVALAPGDVDAAALQAGMQRAVERVVIGMALRRGIQRAAEQVRAMWRVPGLR